MATTVELACVSLHIVEYSPFIKKNNTRAAAATAAEGTERTKQNMLRHEARRPVEYIGALGKVQSGYRSAIRHMKHGSTPSVPLLPPCLPAGTTPSITLHTLTQKKSATFLPFIMV